jgi:hypothetical protein
MQIINFTCVSNWNRENNTSFSALHHSKCNLNTITIKKMYKINLTSITIYCFKRKTVVTSFQGEGSCPRRSFSTPLRGQIRSKRSKMFLKSQFLTFSNYLVLLWSARGTEKWPVTRTKLFQACESNSCVTNGTTNPRVELEKWDRICF